MSQSSSSALDGYREYWYEGDVTLPYKCTEWKFWVNVSARNTQVNLSGGGDNVFHVEATLNNLLAQGNSSPSFTVKAIPFVCVNVQTAMNNGAFDLNGDLLTYEMIQPMKVNTPGGNPSTAQEEQCSNTISTIAFNTATPVYNTTTNPFACNNTFVINSTTGQMSFKPALAGKFTITMLVKEFRNGVQIGSIMRDVQLNALSNCSMVSPPAIALDTNALGTSLVNGVIRNCGNLPINFCFNVQTNTPGAVLVPYDNHTSVIPTGNITYTGALTNSIQGCISWTPGSNDTGLRNIIITIKDSTCLPPGLLNTYQFPISIYVSPATNIFKDTAICAGASVQLFASGGTAFTWSVLPGGSPLTSLSCTGCDNPIATPVITTNYVVSSNLSASVCNKNKDTVTVTVLPMPPTPTASSNSPVCEGDTIKFVSNATGAASYSWTGPGYTSSQQNPVIVNAQAANAGVYHVVGKNGSCSSAQVDVTVVVTPKPATPVVTSNSPLCSGDTLKLTSSSTGATTFIWTGPSGYTSNQQNPVVANAQTTAAGIYHIIGKNGNCSSPQTDITVNVLPSPATPTVTTPVRYCPNKDAEMLIANALAGHTLKWYDPTHNSVPPTPKPVITTEGVFYWYVSQTNGTCESAKDSIAVIVTVDECKEDIKVHNVITPNGDGKNDKWVIVNLEIYPNNTVQLFNKLGDKIFEQSHYMNDWEGGNIPSGMYYYVIDLGTKNRVTGKTSYTGYLMIKR